MEGSVSEDPTYTRTCGLRNFQKQYIRTTCIGARCLPLSFFPHHFLSPAERIKLSHNRQPKAAAGSARIDLINWARSAAACPPCHCAGTLDVTCPPLSPVLRADPPLSGGKRALFGMLRWGTRTRSALKEKDTKNVGGLKPTIKGGTRKKRLQEYLFY